MIENKSNELTRLKLYYETKINELEDNNRQLEINSGQKNEENKRLKIEIEYEKQQNKIEHVKKSLFLFYQIRLLFLDGCRTTFKRI